MANTVALNREELLLTRSSAMRNGDAPEEQEDLDAALRQLAGGIRLDLRALRQFGIDRHQARGMASSRVWRCRS